MSVMLEIKNCIQCPHHQVVPDPDPTDWFNDDDMAVLCTLKKSSSSTSACGRPFEFKPATVSCRPYQLKKETTPVPDWCPLKKVKRNQKKSLTSKGK